MHKTYRPKMLSLLLQLTDLISKNMKISKSQNCWQRWVCSISIFEKTSKVTYYFN